MAIRICPSCGGKVSTTRTTCSHCGYDFESKKELVPMQPGDVPVTYADTTDFENHFGFRPSTSLRTGLKAFARWYKEYYG